MTEAQLQRAVTDLCGLYGIRWHHQRISQFSKPGWPDLVLLGRGRALFRELKQDGRQPTEAQARWGRWLREAGQDWDVWQPADLDSGRIQRELEAIR